MFSMISGMPLISGMSLIWSMERFVIVKCALQNKMRKLSPTAMRKRYEARQENIRFMRAVRRGKERATARTEERVMHSLLYSQITPGLRARVLARQRDLSQKLG